MLVINLLKEIAKQFAGLNPTVSMCYHMDDGDLNLCNVLRYEIPLKPQRFKTCPKEKAQGMYEELFINIKEKKVKCVYVDEMYFVPVLFTTGIIFGKDLNVILQSYYLREISYEIKRLK